MLPGFGFLLVAISFVQVQRQRADVATDAADRVPDFRERNGALGSDADALARTLHELDEPIGGRAGCA